MAIEFVCPSCNGTLQVGDDAAGRVIRCGGCLTMLRVPGADSATAAGVSDPPAAPASPFETGPLSPPPPSRRSTAPPARSEPPPDEPRRDRSRRRRRGPDDFDDGYDGRPRRPRNDGPPPPPGRNVFIWLVVLGGILFIGILSCCGVGFLALPKEDWQQHESKNGGFKVELPAKPRANIAKDIGVGLEKGTSAEGTTLLGQHCLVLYRDIPSTNDRAKEKKTDEDELNEMVEKLLRATGGPDRLRGEPIRVNGFPARELEYRGNRGQYTARVIVADTRRYVVLSFGPQSHDGPLVRKFVDSFEITDPKLVAEGQRRGKPAPDPAKKGNGAQKEDDEKPDAP